MNRLSPDFTDKNWDKLTALILELIMNFAKTVPEFRDLLPEDKVILLQVRHKDKVALE